MPTRLQWQETKRPGGAVVTFDGPGMPPSRAWAGLGTLPVAAYLAWLAYYAPNPKPVTHEAWFRLAPIILALAGVALFFSEFPGVHAGVLDIDRARIVVDPIPSWRLRVEVPLAGIDYVTTQSDSGETTGTGRFRVRVVMRDGRRTTLATFTESDAALFMTQRLEALLERARSSAIAPPL